MKLSYNLSSKDFAVALEAANKSLFTGLQRHVLMGNLLVWICLGFGATAAFRALERDPAWSKSPVLFVAVSLGLAFLLQIALTEFIRKKAVEAQRNSLAPFPLHQAIAINPAGVTTESRFGRTDIPWSAIRSVKESNGYVLIVFASASAWAVPPSAFESQAHRASFVEALVRGSAS